MKKIYEKKSLANAVLGKQSVYNEKRYILSQFCILTEIDNKRIIYNKMFGTMYELSSSEKKVIDSLPCRITNANVELIEKWIVVPEDFNELILADQIVKINETMSSSSYIDTYTILTTTCCNARCFYCYENGTTKKTMSKQTANDVANYIMTKSKNNPVRIKWFGGEPLVNTVAIDTICEKLALNNVEYSSSMVTNGFLFNENLAKRAKSFWNLKKLQITLDGTEEVYNTIKNYICDSKISPFEKVINNVALLLNAEIFVNIRLNLSNDNYDNLNELVSFLYNKFGNNDFLSIGPHILYEYYQAPKSSLLDINNKNNHLTDYIDKLGLTYKNKKEVVSFSRGCMAQNDHAIVVAPDGTIGKCEHFFDKEKTIGSIYSNNFDLETVNYWKHRTITPWCKNCTEYIQCSGYDSCPNFYGRCELQFDTIRARNIREIKHIYNKQKFDEVK